MIPSRERGDPSRARVERVVALGARVADPADPLGIEARERVRATSGLSAAGVELALGRHLETAASEADLAALLARTGRAGRCHVVLAANVCTGALRAIALAVATAPDVLVRPSRRDPALAAILARELSRDPAFAGSIAIPAALAPAQGDEVHAYGRDATMHALRAGLPDGVTLREHGSGFGVALIGAAVDLEAAGRALAKDVVPFDQAGCLSPRIAIVEGPAARGEALADALDRALAAASLDVPRGDVDAATRTAIALYRASIEAVGVHLAGADHAVGLDLDPRALVLPPAARVVHVVPADAATAISLLAPWARFLTVLGADDDGPLTIAARALAPRARRARLGAMQTPPLDGPVDLRRG